MNRYALLSAALALAAAGCNIPSLQIFAGTATESVTGQLRADDAGAPGDTLDVRDDLGVADKDAPFDARLVFAKGRGLLDVSYARRSIDSTGSLAATADFGGVTLAAGAVDSSLTLDEYRVCVGLRAKHKEGVYTLRAGVVGADWSATLTDSGAQTATAAQFTVVPVVGVGAEMDLGPFASLVLEGEMMDMDLFETKASLVEWRAGIKFMVVQGMHLMLGYRSRELDLEEEGQRFSLGLDGGTVAFQLGLTM